MDLQDGDVFAKRSEKPELTDFQRRYGQNFSDHAAALAQLGANA
ncbi:hypothetical protein [Sphingomonas sp.]